MDSRKQLWSQSSIDQGGESMKRILSEHHLSNDVAMSGSSSKAGSVEKLITKSLFTSKQAESGSLFKSLGASQQSYNVSDENTAPSSKSPQSQQHFTSEPVDPITSTSSRLRIRKPMVKEVQTSPPFRSAQVITPNRLSVKFEDRTTLSGPNEDSVGHLQAVPVESFQISSFQGSPQILEQHFPVPRNAQKDTAPETIESSKISQPAVAFANANNPAYANYDIPLEQIPFTLRSSSRRNTTSFAKFPTITDSKYAYQLPTVEDEYYPTRDRKQARKLHERSLQNGIALNEARIAREIEEGHYVKPTQPDKVSLIESLSSVFVQLATDNVPQHVVSHGTETKRTDERTDTSNTDVSMINAYTSADEPTSAHPPSTFSQLNTTKLASHERDPKFSQLANGIEQDSPPVKYSEGMQAYLMNSSSEVQDQAKRTAFEEMRQFDSWAIPDARSSRPKSQVRRVILTGLPSIANARHIAHIVFGGPVEQIILSIGRAEVLFLKSEHCMTFYEKSKPGFDWPDKSSGRIQVQVQLADCPEPVNSTVQNYIQSEFTRCVRVIGVEEHWGVPSRVEQLAQGKPSNPRKVEKINGAVSDSGVRRLDFRFCNIKDAVAFRGQLLRDDEWERCNIQFFKDPCDEPTNTRL